jgi:hypothetical protein
MASREIQRLGFLVAQLRTEIGELFPTWYVGHGGPADDAPWREHPR